MPPQAVGQLSYLFALAIIPQSIMLYAPGHSYLVLRHPEMGMRYGTAMGQINHGIHVFFVVVFALTILQVLLRLRKLIKEHRKQLAQA